MKCLAIHSSPNKDGLTESLAQAVLDGFASEGGETEMIRLNHMEIKPCLACERGWGPCRQGNCTREDDFEEIRGKIRETDVMVFVNPVYFGDLSESAKRFLDRLQRTEFFSGRNNTFGTRAVAISAAGGSGNGAARALYNLEEILKRLGFEIVDLVTVTKFSKDHKLPMLEQVGKRLAKGVPGVAPRR